MTKRYVNIMMKM